MLGFSFNSDQPRAAVRIRHELSTVDQPEVAGQRSNRKRAGDRERANVTHRHCQDSSAEIDFFLVRHDFVYLYIYKLHGKGTRFENTKQAF